MKPKHKSTIGIGLLTAITASLCCITPVLAFIAGASGVAATFSWLEPFRPYLIGLTVLMLGFTWYQKLKTGTAKEMACACEEDEKPSFWQSKKFLSIMTLFAGLMLVFPGYAHIFYPRLNNQNFSSVNVQDTTRQMTIHVKGMTCAGCEAHIENAVAQLPGVKMVTASYESGTAVVDFLPGKLQKGDIVAAINKTGYKVVDENSNPEMAVNDPGNISFYKVPLVCNAAPTIGCGSRSKPVLLDFEESQSIEEAWLNRQGTVIAIVWKTKTDFQIRRNVITGIFSQHQMNASEVLMNDYAENLDSFSKKDGWYRGTDVNKLSREEAGIIADRLLKPIKEKTDLNSGDERKLREKITASFYDFFLNYRSLDELGDPDVHKAILSDIISFGEALLGKNEVPELDELWSICSGDAKGCNHEGCSSTCKLN